MPSSVAAFVIAAHLGPPNANPPDEVPHLPDRKASYVVETQAGSRGVPRQRVVDRDVRQTELVEFLGFDFSLWPEKTTGCVDLRSDGGVIGGFENTDFSVDQGHDPPEVVEASALDGGRGCCHQLFFALANS